MAYRDFVASVEKSGWSQTQWHNGFTLLHWACDKGLPQWVDYFIRARRERVSIGVRLCRHWDCGRCEQSSVSIALPVVSPLPREWITMELGTRAKEYTQYAALLRARSRRGRGRGGLTRAHAERLRAREGPHAARGGHAALRRSG